MHLEGFMHGVTYLDLLYVLYHLLQESCFICPSVCCWHELSQAFKSIGNSVPSSLLCMHMPTAWLRTHVRMFVITRAQL